MAKGGSSGRQSSHNRRETQEEQLIRGQQISSVFKMPKLKLPKALQSRVNRLDPNKEEERLNKARSRLQVMQDRLKMQPRAESGGGTSAGPKSEAELLNQIEVLGGPGTDPGDAQAFELGKIEVETAETKVIHIFKSRNIGAKEFDDFARGVQSWFSMVEMEAIKRFHSLYMDPIVEAMEEYLERLALELVDLIAKALMLSKLKKYKKRALAIGHLALKAIEAVLDELEKAGQHIPIEKFITVQDLELLEEEVDQKAA